MKTLEDLNALVDIGKKDNIELVIQFCEEQDLLFEEIDTVKEHVPIIK